MEISKQKFGFSMAASIIGTALVLVPLTMNLTKKKCDKEKDSALMRNDEEAQKNINEIRSEFGNKLKGKDEIIEKLVSLLKRDDNCSGK